LEKGHEAKEAEGKRRGVKRGYERGELIEGEQVKEPPHERETQRNNEGRRECEN
jgi:hypothetical protein